MRVFLRIEPTAIDLPAGNSSRLTWLSEGGLLTKWVADMSGAWEGCEAIFNNHDHEALEFEDLEGLFRKKKRDHLPRQGDAT